MPNETLIVLLNGPLGVGKSTLGELLGETMDRSVTLDGDRLSALNPPPADELASLHATLALLVAHHLSQGYSRFIVNHFWQTAEEIGDLFDRIRAVAPNVRMECFRLTLDEAENRRRILSRRHARAIDEAEFEDRQFAQEFALFSRAEGNELGIPFDASDPPGILVERMLGLLGLPEASAQP